MDTYQPSTAGVAWQVDAALNSAYAEGRAHEREQWVPLVNLIHAHFLQYAQGDGSVHLPLTAVLELSAALGRVQGD
jgi:hypothetical protein